MDSTQRFSDRVENYVRYRPGYPPELISILRDGIGLRPNHRIADIGSGTGISCELFLKNGNPVVGVEPNPDMRQAAERLLRQYPTANALDRRVPPVASLAVLPTPDSAGGGTGGTKYGCPGQYPRFTSISAPAEATTLPDQSIDIVTAFQAFHWFDHTRTRREFARILKPTGHLVIVWNVRKTAGTPFLEAYEKLLLDCSPDYAKVRHENVSDEAIAHFFGGPFEKRTAPNRQSFDLDGVIGRLLSSSYAPMPSHPNHAPMMTALREIFARHNESGRVAFEYDTQVYFGRLSCGD